MKKYFAAILLLGLLAVFTAAQAQAQGDRWPSRPIRLVVPFAPGGNNDSVARIAANRMQQVLGVSVIVENRGGAGGSVGANLVPKPPPGGYRLSVGRIRQIALAPATEQLPYDPLHDLAPISLVNTNPLLLLVTPSLKASSVAELIALARAEPNRLNYSSSGVGGLMYFSAELFKAKTK